MGNRKLLALARKVRNSPALMHLVACALPFAALLVQLSIDQLAPQTSYQLFLAAVVLSAWLGGTLDGVLALAISAGGRFLVFPTPRVAFALGHPAELLRLTLFAAIGAVAAWLVGRLRTAQSQLTAALASAVDAVAVTDKKNRVTFLNPVAEALTGWTRESAHGRPLEQVVRFAAGVSGEDALLMSRAGIAIPVEHTASAIRGPGTGCEGISPCSGTSVSASRWRSSSGKPRNWKLLAIWPGVWPMTSTTF